MKNFKIYYIVDIYNNIHSYYMKGILSKFFARIVCKNLNSKRGYECYYVRVTSILDLLEL